MSSLYQSDLAYVHASAFGGLAQSAAPEVIRRLRGSKAKIRRVLDVGCGAGPLAKALTDARFEVTGIDTSPDLLDMARASVPAARFLHASAYEFDVKGYDAVLAVGEPLTYHSDAAQAGGLVSGFFRRVADALPAEGMLIFDVIGLGEPSLAARTWMSGEDWAVLVETSENQNEKTLVRNMETFRSVGDAYRRSREVHRVRLFAVEQLRSELTALGFEVEIAQAYGEQRLPPRRHALFATRT